MLLRDQEQKETRWFTLGASRRRDKDANIWMVMIYHAQKVYTVVPIHVVLMASDLFSCFELPRSFHNLSLYAKHAISSSAVS